MAWKFGSGSESKWIWKRDPSLNVSTPIALMKSVTVLKIETSLLDTFEQKEKEFTYRYILNSRNRVHIYRNLIRNADQQR